MKDHIRVLHLLDSLSRGGAESLVIDACSRGEAYGLELSLLSLGGGEMETDQGLGGIAHSSIHRKFPIDPHVVRRIAEVVRKDKISIVHVHQPVEALHAFLATLKLNVKLVMTYHGVLRDVKNRMLARLLPWMIDHHISVSNSFVDQIRTSYRLPQHLEFQIVPNGIDPTRFVGHSRERLRKELRIEAGDCLMGMIGNFMPGKDQLTICKALRSVDEVIHNFHFVFVGAPGLEPFAEFQECRRFCEQSGLGNRVHFLGSRSDVPAILASLDLFVFSSVDESFGMAVVEAMMAKVPILVTAIPAMLEVTSNGTFGRLFPPQDSENLSHVLIELCQHEQMRRSGVTDAFDWALANYAIGEHMIRLRSCYEGVLAKCAA